MANANGTTTVGWASRWTFIMAATGSAVGLGNIWKFPYITGEYGGGAFVLVYLLCITLVGIPVMMAEVLIGRQGRSDPIHSVLTLARACDATKLWTVVGIMGVLAGLVILSFVIIDIAPIDIGFNELRVYLQGLTVIGNCLIRLAFVLIGSPPVVVGLSIPRVYLYGPVVIRDGLIILAFL